MRQDNLRNPELYRRLCGAFGGQRNVKQHRGGQPGEFGKGQFEHEGYRRYRLEKKGAYVGEEFSVSCPFCNDTKRRLYINHLWGTADPYNGKQILWLWHCYNEECQGLHENRVKLARILFDDEHELLEVNKAAVAPPRVKRSIALPGVMQDLLTLAVKQPNHPAVQFCYGRGYRLDELTHMYGVGYCTMEVDYGGSAGEGRIVAPWYFRKRGKVELGGWTARRVVDADTPKWVHGAPTADVVYGLGDAARYRTVVIDEGPGDKWAVGPQAGAVFGKFVNAQKARLIAKALEPNIDKHAVVVLLDPDMDVVQKKAGRPHHIDVSVKELKRVLKCPVVGIYLPSKTDPGSLERDYMWDYMAFQAKKQGVSISQDTI